MCLNTVCLPLREGGEYIKKASLVWPCYAPVLHAAAFSIVSVLDRWSHARSTPMRHAVWRHVTMYGSAIAAACGLQHKNLKNARIGLSCFSCNMRQLRYAAVAHAAASVQYVRDVFHCFICARAAAAASLFVVCPALGSTALRRKQAPSGRQLICRWLLSPTFSAAILVPLASCRTTQAVRRCVAAAASQLQLIAIINCDKATNSCGFGQNKQNTPQPQTSSSC